MLFQALDDKKYCAGVYQDGELYYDDLPNNLTRTWGYAEFLENRDIQYAKLYCGGKTLQEVCPESLKPRWEAANNKLKAFYRSFRTARVSLNENCFYDLVPERYLLEWCYVKDMICDHVFQTFDKPDNYGYLASLSRAMTEIGNQRLNIDKGNLLIHKSKHLKFGKSLNSIPPYCRFNMWGTKTGRLTTTKASFPILTLDKELRRVLRPTNDYFVELDFNAAELRTLLSLQGREQPKGDLHEWNIKNVFQGKVTRDEAKKRIFAWLYNPESHDDLCEFAYDRTSVLKKHFTQGQVRTVFDKTIPSENRTALNYIIQSTCAENVLRQMIKVSNYMRGCKSYVAFPIHDSIVLDFSIEDRERLGEIIDIFSTTDLGKFKVNLSVGKDFGNLKKLEV